MASGKQSPRQKMINLMYLVFIAMLALNMSKEVLTAFGLMNEKLEEANVVTTQRNQLAMAGLAEKAAEQPAKYVPLKQQADQVNNLTEDLVSYIEGIKTSLTADLDDVTDYETMDKSNELDELWYKGGKITPAGQEFVDEMDKFRNGIVATVGADNPAIKAEVEKEFSTAPEKDRDGVEKDWINYNYVGFPLVASITKLTQIQADAKTIENEILSDLLAGQLKSEVSMTNYEAIVVPEKTAFFNGENFKGKVVLGRFDNSLNFDKVTVNGRTLEKTVGGQVVLDFPAGNVGEQNIKGELQFKEGDSLVTIPIESSYAVIPKPNAAVISADKMNVVYRGVNNPMTISIPGVGNVTANASGLKSAGGAGKYTMNVTTLRQKEVKINVSGKLPGGETVSDSKTFRIKDIPRPVGTVRGEDGSVKMQRNGLEISTIGATLPDFDFDLKLGVASFKFKVPGQPTVQVNGSKLDGRAKSALRQARRGETVQIFDIDAKLVGNSGYKLKKVSPIIIELTN